MIPPIEKNVPIPFTLRDRAKYGFDTMAIGDSRAWPLAETVRVRVAASAYAKRNPAWSYQTATTGTEVRLWRVR
jgi:hypothetical protein